MSRTASRYSSSLARSLRLTRPLQARDLVGHRIKNAAIRLASRASRTAGSVLPPSPKSRSKTARGLFSIGSGVVGVAPADRVHVGAAEAGVAGAGEPGRFQFAVRARPAASAAPGALPRSGRSMTPARKSPPSVGLACTPVRKAGATRPCPPAGSPCSAMPGLLSSPLTTSRWSRNGSSGFRIG